MIFRIMFISMFVLIIAIATISMFDIVIVIITYYYCVFRDMLLVMTTHASRQGLGIHEAVLEFEISPNDMPGISRPRGFQASVNPGFCGAA